MADWRVEATEAHTAREAERGTDAEEVLTTDIAKGKLAELLNSVLGITVDPAVLEIARHEGEGDIHFYLGGTPPELWGNARSADGLREADLPIRSKADAGQLLAIVNTAPEAEEPEAADADA